MRVGTNSARAMALAVAALAVAGVGTWRVRAFEPVRSAGPVVVASPTSSPSPASSPSPTPAPKPKPTATATKVALPYPLPAKPAAPNPCVTKKPTGPVYVRKTPKVFVAESKLPAPLAASARQVSLHAISGKGMWIYQMKVTEGGDATRIVAKAKALGLRQIWVRTGGTIQGYYGDPILRSLLPKAHAAGVKVIAWDFPYLHDPVGDARRAEAALRFRTADGHQLDGFSPDIETAGEGTIATSRRVEVYLGLVRRAAGSRPVVVTVPRASEKRMRTYPYASMAKYADAFAPMVYWSCREPGELALESIRRLSRLRPVHIIGQSYDMGIEGGRRGDPRGAELWRFLDVGHRHGAIGASFYVWQTTTAEQFAAVRAFPWTRSL
jgi:hypothetical protein